MIKDVWINLPVKDLARSIAFYQGIGLSRKTGPGNTENSACFAIGEKSLVLMLFVESVFAGFTNNPLTDCSKGTEVLFSLGVEGRAQVEELAKRAAACGGRVYRAPAESNGTMYGCGIVDPDGHRWNALYMDLARRDPAEGAGPSRREHC
jgi:predicted lactoylglutathione lyase